MLRLFHAASYAGRFDHPRSVSRKPKHAAGLSKLALPSQSCAAPLAGRLDLICDGKAIQPSGEKPDSISGQPAPGVGTTGLFSTVPEKARHCSRTMLPLQE